MKKIILNKEYVSDQKDVSDLFLETNKNLYLKKGSTGIGGTTVILKATDRNRIVVSPTVGMIQGKEKQLDCYFIYGGSNDTWDDYKNDTDIKVVNCTPEQILSVKKHNPELFEELINTTIFVDEIHSYIPDSTYRDSMVGFLDVLFNEWKSNWILSSATDNTIEGILLDVPPGIQYEAYEIVKPTINTIDIEIDRGENISIKKILDVVENSISNGRKVLVATNRTKIHQQLSKIQSNEEPDYNVVHLVGSNIEKKMKPYTNLDNSNIKWDDIHIVLISSRFFAGFDIHLDLDVIIDTNPHIKSNMIGVNDIRQIIGRPRLGVGRLVLFISYNQPREDSSLLYIPNINKQDIINEISKITKTNWLELSTSIISDYTYYTLLDNSILTKELIRYNLNPVKYNTIKHKSLSIMKHPFNEQIMTLMNEDLDSLILDFGVIKKYLKYKFDGIFSPDLALLYYCVIKIKRIELTTPNWFSNTIKLNSKTKPKRFYQTINKYFKEDVDWRLLFGYLKSKLHISMNGILTQNQYPKKTLDYLEIRSLPSIEIVNNNVSPFACYLECESVLKTKGIEIDNDERDKLKDRCKEIYSHTDFNGIKTRKQLLNTIGWAHLLLLNGGREEYNFPIKRNRQYTPITQIPSCLRDTIETPIIEIDIKQANPTFIDKILGSNVGENVYDTIMTKYKVSRERAKVLYNTYLNNDKQSQEHAYDFFNSIGYTPEQSLSLSEMIVERKGKVYDEMVKQERDIIESFCDAHLGNTTWFRFHDAILIIDKEYNDEIKNLPSEFNGIKFNYKYYNKDYKFNKDEIEDLFDYL